MARHIETERIVDDESTPRREEHDRTVRAVRAVPVIAPRRRWPAVLAAMLLGAALAAVLVSSFYDSRSAGEKLDAATAAAGNAVQGKVEQIRADAVDGTTSVAERTAIRLSDAGITAAVKTALAADPTLSALKIKVDTDNGVVSLSGPAPDIRSRERAQVIAAAPTGVQRVENRLVVTQ